MKRVKGKPDKINELILKMKTEMKKGMIIYNTHHWIMLTSLGFHLERDVHLKLDVQVQGGRNILDLDGQGGEGSWKLDNFHGRYMCIIP